MRGRSLYISLSKDRFLRNAILSTNIFFRVGIMGNIVWQQVEVFEGYEIHSVLSTSLLTPNTLNLIRQSQMLLEQPRH